MAALWKTISDKEDSAPKKRAVREPGRVSVNGVEKRNVSYVWVLGAEEFDSAKAAAIAKSVSVKTVRRWCMGYVRHDGVAVKPRSGCKVVKRN